MSRRIHKLTGIADKPREAFERMFDLLNEAECLNLVKLDNGKWVVGMSVVQPSQKECEEWEKEKLDIYNTKK